MKPKPPTGGPYADPEHALWFQTYNIILTARIQTAATPEAAVQAAWDGATKALALWRGTLKSVP